MEEMESVGGSATSMSLSAADEEVFPAEPTPPVVEVLPKNAILRLTSRTVLDRGCSRDASYFEQ